MGQVYSIDIHVHVLYTVHVRHRTNTCTVLIYMHMYMGQVYSIDIHVHVHHTGQTWDKNMYSIAIHVHVHVHIGHRTNIQY